MDHTFSEQISSPVDGPNDVSSRWRRARRARTSVEGPEARSGPSPAGGITIEANAAATNPASVSLARNGGFLLLWAGQFVSQMGDRLAMVAFPWFVYKSTGSALGTGAVRKVPKNETARAVERCAQGGALD